MCLQSPLREASPMSLREEYAWGRVRVRVKGRVRVRVRVIHQPGA